MTLPTWLVAGGSLLLGFLVAQATGIRPLGGLVLLGAVAWCWLRWRAQAGTGVALVLTGAYAAAFVLSHVLARAIGGVPAVLLVSAAMALLTLALADRRAPAGVRG